MLLACAWCCVWVADAHPCGLKLALHVPSLRMYVAAVCTRCGVRARCGVSREHARGGVGGWRLAAGGWRLVAGAASGAPQARSSHPCPSKPLPAPPPSPRWSWSTCASWWRSTQSWRRAALGGQCVQAVPVDSAQRQRRVEQARKVAAAGGRALAAAGQPAGGRQADRPAAGCGAGALHLGAQVEEATMLEAAGERESSCICMDLVLVRWYASQI